MDIELTEDLVLVPIPDFNWFARLYDNNTRDSVVVSRDTLIELALIVNEGKLDLLFESNMEDDVVSC